MNGSLEFRIVQTLRMQGPSSASAVTRGIDSVEPGTTTIQAVVQTLRRMVSKGIVDVRSQVLSTSDDKRRRGDVYEANDAGIAAADAFQKSMLLFHLPESNNTST